MVSHRKATPGRGLKFKVKLRGSRSAGSGGDDDREPSPPPPFLYPDLTTLSTSPLPPQPPRGSSGDDDDDREPSPPPPFFYPDPSAVSTSAVPPQPRRVSSGDDDGEPAPPPPVYFDPSAVSIKYTDELLDDEDWKKEKPTGSSDEKFYFALFMSIQKSLPRDIFRQDSVPLNKDVYFSLWKNWDRLLDGKRTYLRPPKDHCATSGIFRCPDARTRTLGGPEPLLDLVKEYPNKYRIREMIKILSQHYVLFRRTRRDGNCFYRAFLFSYLENLGQMQDSQAEATRLMERVAMYRENFCRLKWDMAYFLNPEEYFSSVVSEFNDLVNSVANGGSSDKLYKRSLQEIISLRILSLLRLLTETEIRTREEDYRAFCPAGVSVFQYCWTNVRPMDVEVLTLPMRALTYALGIPLRVEAVGGGKTDGIIQVKRLDFFPRSESGKGLLHLVESYWSSMTAPEPLEMGSGNLFSSDGTPLLTLLCRYNQCGILYRK
ncbi:uncharacterized protein LOC100823583 isoform X2 [Brachypodium distachyon]|uniref:Uncharacterized protein n=1 Tax=Brachypodium distachyon TaxID=15368 RepID=I1I1F9_BRADI|nr:uncharacterized protein LOC100823583 isoform X2 [Brachypodium distachyon]PNT66745.1 hypothetical protein BRADI_3g16570v3 [Brachypodium distachyon]|eukprot:XP_010234386.1 uncharacterized protein LOC100823583 isoform X2 [Brachypodium distachyon]